MSTGTADDERLLTDGGQRSDDEAADGTVPEPDATAEEDATATSGLSRWYEAAANTARGVRSFEMPGLSSFGGDEDFTFLFYNTWLLDGIELPELEFGPLGTVSPGTIGRMPDLDGRTRDLCRALTESNYDVVALCEVFQRETREALAEQVEGVTDSYAGPGATSLERIDFPSKHSGLYTLTGNGNPIVDSSEVGFDHRGNSLRDADFYANKGAQHVEVDIGPGKVDVFTTHLLHGGDLNLDPADIPFSDPDSIEEYRAKQLEELTTFVQEAGSAENLTIVAGDFNLNVEQPRLVPERNRTEVDLFEAFKQDCSLYDPWERHGGPVNTTYIEHGPPGGMDRAKVDPINPNYLEDHGERCEYPDVPDRRIDYVLVEEPQPAHTFELEVEHIRRRHFWRGKTNTREFWATSDVPNYISDHVGLELDCTLG
jgi:endonuclease/exonuclease/phosphatase family metal-dependent hydrolase